MIAFVLALVLLVISLLGIALRKVYYYLPGQELKRQAESGSSLARSLWPAVAYGPSLGLFLWVWIGLAAAGGFILLVKVAPWELALVAVAGIIWLAFAWFPARIKLTGLEARLAKWCTPMVAQALHYVQPLLAPFGKKTPQPEHTNLFESADLLELLERQQEQADNRIAPAELDRAKRALTAHHYKVGDVLTSRQDVKTVSDADTVGLVLLDELHASGQSSFPVRAGRTDKFVGTLYLHDLGLKTEGRVKDYMQPGIRYLHEDDSLDQALQAFYKTRQQSFVVINSFEEYVGIVTLEAIIAQLSGEATSNDFDQHHDPAAVAAKHLHDDEPAAEPEVSDTEAEPDEVALPAPEDDGDAAATDEDFSDMDIDADEADAAVSGEPLEPDSEAAQPADQTKATADPDSLAALDLPDEEPAPKPTPKPTAKK